MCVSCVCVHSCTCTICENSVRNKNSKYLQVPACVCMCVFVTNMVYGVYITMLVCSCTCTRGPMVKADSDFESADWGVQIHSWSSFFLIFFNSLISKLSIDNIFVYCNNDEWV